jgi:hypothetical protein
MTEQREQILSTSLAQAPKIPNSVSVECHVIQSVDAKAKFRVNVPEDISESDLLKRITDKIIDGNLDYQVDFSSPNGTSIMSITPSAELTNAACLGVRAQLEPIPIDEDITQLGMRVCSALRQLEKSGEFSKFTVEVLKAVELSGIGLDAKLIPIAEKQYLESDEHAIMHPDAPSGRRVSWCP